LKGAVPRVVLRGTGRHFIAQLVDYKPSGDVTIASAHSSELAKSGWKAGTANIPAAYLTGLLLGKRAKDKCSKAILDIGLQAPVINSRLFAGAKGVVDAGVNMSLGQEIPEDRLTGKHIDDKLPAQFETVKKKILGAK